VADDLGTAVLRITVDDSEARRSLGLLRQDVEQATRQARAARSSSAQGGARDPIRALEQAQERRFRNAQRIQRLEDRGANVSRLRARLGEQTEAQSQRAFERSRRISVDLSRQIRLAEARLQREQQITQEINRQARLSGPSEAIGGRRGLSGSPADLAFLARQGGPRSPVGGSLAIPDSPAFLAAARRAGESQARAFQQEIARAARSGGARSPLGGAVDIPGSPAFLAAQRRFQQQELSRAAALGGPRSPIGGSTLLAGSPAATRAEERLAAARARATQAAERAAVAEGRRIGRLNVSPVRGGPQFPGSPGFFESIFPAFPGAELRRRDTARLAAQRRNRDIASNAIIGGAFPLLFGQGIGASIGGAGGGAAGGAIGGQFGFGLSLLGTAVGAQFDAIVQKAATLGKALEDPIRSFSQLQEAGLLSSRGLERQVESLIAVGREAEAAALIQADLAASYGGLEAATKLAEEQDRLNRSWSQFSVALGQIAISPIADSAQNAADALGGLASALRTISEATPPAVRQILSGTLQAADTTVNPLGGFIRGAADLFNRARGGQDQQQQTQQTAEAAEATVAAEQRRSELLSAQFRLISAQEQGYKGLTLQRQKEVSLAREAVDLDRLRAKNAKEPELQARREEGNLERFTLEEKALRLQKEIQASKISEAAKGDAINAAASRQLGFAREIAAIGTGAAREELQARQQILESIAQARDRIAQIDADIKAAEIVGDPDKVASLAQQRAAAETQLVATQVQGATALRDLEAQRVANEVRRTAEIGLQSQAVEQQITAAQELGQTELGAARQILELRKQVAESIRAAKAQESTIGAEISAARIVGDARRATELVVQQRIAADQTRLAYIEGATALRDASTQLREDAKEVENSLSNLRASNLEYLTPQQQSDLLAKLRRESGARESARGITLITPLDQAGEIQARQRFLNFDRAETELIKKERDIDRARTSADRSITESNDALVSSNTELTAAVQELAGKSWNVVVNVEGGNGAQVIGDVVGAL
jgi:hypothetical protein